MAGGQRLREVAVLSPTETEAVLRLARRAEAEDGFSPLNESELLHLRYSSAGVTHLLATRDDGLQGYGQLESRGDLVSGAIVVDPEQRRIGVGDALLARMVDQAGPRLRIWATRDTPAAQALARGHGLVPRRTLLILQRSLTQPLPSAPLPPGIILRGFRPGADELGWLRANARAFATHPEQGSLTLADLQQRMAEPWFDPVGFLVAVRDESPTVIIGFHWTKRHSAELGEVYVLGVDPTAGVRGLGRPLLLAGLAHLRAVGCASVLLYVEADNERALRLYEWAGFTVTSRDVSYGFAADLPPAGANLGASAGVATMQEAAPGGDE